MQTRLRVLTEDTLLPISIVVALFGGVAWLTSLYDETQLHSQVIQELSQDQRHYNEKLDKILQKLSHIEGKLGMDPR